MTTENGVPARGVASGATNQAMDPDDAEALARLAAHGVDFEDCTCAHSPFDHGAEGCHAPEGCECEGRWVE